jgi:hypothetical protein
MEITPEFRDRLPIIKQANDKICHFFLKQNEIHNDIHNQINDIPNSLRDNLIFVHCPPKVGSTSLISSIRLSACYKFNIIHLHDEDMLYFFTGVNNVSVNELIQYNSYIGKNVYVIDIYRSPIERKISDYFEHLSYIHFNNLEEKVNNYDINRIINRFNKVFPHISKGDHYIDKFNLILPDSFNYTNKYLSIKKNNVNYIKLRLKDSSEWGNILTKILNTEIIMVTDYQTDNKKIGGLYKKFKEEYKLPFNFFEMIKNDKYFQYYYSDEERNEYLGLWSRKLSPVAISYTEDEFTFYFRLCLENQTSYEVQDDHYIDNGCLCKWCSLKRLQIFEKLKRGLPITEKIIHKKIINDINEKKKDIINKLINNNNNNKKKMGKLQAL